MTKLSSHPSSLSTLWISSSSAFPATSLTYLTYASWFLVEQRAATTPLQRTQFWLVLFSSAYVVPAAFISASVLLRQVCFGRPTLRFPCGFQSRAKLVHSFQSHIGFWCSRSLSWSWSWSSEELSAPLGLSPAHVMSSTWEDSSSTKLVSRVSVAVSVTVSFLYRMGLLALS